MQRHNHTQEQKALLHQMLIDAGQKLLAINFTDAAQDAQQIRYHAHVKGQYVIILQLLEDDYPETDHTTEQNNGN